jgi:Flp pilus assembly protein TadB
MKTPILITQDEFIVKTDKETKIQPLEKFADGKPATFVINRAVAMDAANSLTAFVHKNIGQFYLFFGGFAWLIFALFAYVLRIFMILILGLAGLLIGSLMRTKLDYSAAVSLAAVSFTPVALLETVILITSGYPVHTSTLFIAGIVTLTAAIVFSKPLPPTSPAA